MPFLLTILTVILMVFTLADIITRSDDQVKFLPKMVWVILAIILPLVGSILWFLVGRQYDGSGIGIPRPRPARPRPTATAPAPPIVPVDTRTTEQQIADLDREIEEWRLKQEIEKRKQERDGTADDA